MSTQPINLNLATAIRDCSRQNWQSALKWLAFSIVFGFMPIWMGALMVFALSGQHLVWSDFIVHGEFAIYSAGLTAASARLISKDTELGPFVHRELFILFAFSGFGVAVGLYVTIKTAIYLHFTQVVNSDFILTFSVWLLIYSIIFSFLVFLLDHQRFNPNVRSITARQQAELEQRFDSLGDNDHAQQ